jgi:4-alpha-L-fucosyltransferase (Fuc4NAc transferase).
MKYVHVIINNAYTAPYIDLITRNFKAEDHVFYVIRGWSEEKVKIPVQNNVHPINNRKNLKNGWKLIKDMNASKKIFLHGLFSPYLLLTYVLQPWLLKRSNWIIWGGDLHHYQYLVSINNVKLKDRIEEYLKKKCIQRFSEITTIIRGDYELAKKWYGAKGLYKRAMYSSAIQVEEIDKIISTTPPDADKGTLAIQMGNSAAPENNHFQILDLLKDYRDQNIKIYALLSYGDGEYADKITAYGRSIFGDKFIAVRDYMEFKDFVRFMNKMDLIVFNHQRQQALGNLLLAAYLKKKIYINPESTLWELFRNEFNIDVQDTQRINEQTFESFATWNETDAENNLTNVKRVLEEKYIVDMWNALFDK